MYLIAKLLPAILALNQVIGWEVEPLEDFNIAKYTGRWYQIYSVGLKGPSLPELPKAFCGFFDFNLLKNGMVAISASARPDDVAGVPIEIDQLGKVLNPGIFEFEQLGDDNSKHKYQYFVEKVGPAIHGTKGLYDYAIVVTKFEDLSMFIVAARDPATFKEKYDSQVMEYLTKNGHLENDMKTCKPVSKYLMEHYHGYDCVYR